jgi:hypothetical protein
MHSLHRIAETPEAFRIRQKRYGSIALFGTIISILAIELTLLWNNIGGVYSISSTGQLIAFIVGLVPLITTIYGVLKETAEAVSAEMQISLIVLVTANNRPP